MTKSWMVVSVIVCAVGFAAPASAAEQQAEDAAATSNRGVVTLPQTDIAGRLDRPQAAMAISRMGARVTLVRLEQMFLDRIEQSVFSGPF